ncbi:phage tail protein [Lactobacillus sp. LC28-10]|uniref:Phage tail protein n=1 Tax=Secundilactobacillus angelensis TaxID=2722706 RepID=A0ABX1KWZ7_9LACO|nr:phage tail protein [Secundilactobacillus angelensis]MCH5461502.1 phage tail protein [Secundilactobacillus angelensis]NLR17685.1 phage tail protein [Secundilactobacillus angelensis]
MAVVGLKMIKAALLDDTGKILSGEDGLSTDGLYSIDEKDMGSKTANITGLEGTLTKVSGNNKVMDAYVGPAAPSVALDINNLAFDVAQKMLGNVSDGTGGYLFAGSKPHVALLIETQTLDRKNSIYFGFANGNMTAASQNVATDTDTAQTREDDALTYTALAPVDGKTFVNANGDVQLVKRYFTGDEGFDEATMLAEVFGGYAAGTTGTTGTGATDSGK